MVTLLHGTSSIESAANIFAGVVPPLTAKDATPRRVEALRNFAATQCAASVAAAVASTATRISTRLALHVL